VIVRGRTKHIGGGSGNRRRSHSEDTQGTRRCPANSRAAASECDRGDLIRPRVFVPAGERAAWPSRILR
jgi:hypothetical protein